MRPIVIAKELLTVTDTSDFPLLVSTLDRTVSDSINFGYVKTLPMKYGILFDGTSSLRSLVDNDIIDLLKQQKTYYHRIAAILLLFRGNLEAASHEVVLGVSPAELEEAEYAASHPGETSWSEDHPLTTASDMIHSIIHRLEGYLHMVKEITLDTKMQSIGPWPVPRRWISNHIIIM